MSAKDLNKKLEDLFKEQSKQSVTYEGVVELFDKQPTLAQSKKILELTKKYDVTLMSSSEKAKILNIADARKKEEERAKIRDAELSESFDFLKEKELLEWSRSDSPVRMYLREMGQIQLLTKDEEIEISKKIEIGEDIIIDAICSVPYLIDFILDYKEALINRERRVKELFKSFEDDSEEEDEEEEIEGEEQPLSKDAKNRVEKVLTSFKALEKAKKDWMKVLNRDESEIPKDGDEADILTDELGLTFKKKVTKRETVRFRSNK